MNENEKPAGINAHCPHCQQEFKDCPCPKVDEYFYENGHLMRDQQRPVAPVVKLRCLACDFLPCRCRQGLEGRRKAGL